MSSLIERKSFSKIQDCIELPNLVEIQIESYEQFLQTDRSKRRRKRQGLEAAFQDSFPIESFDRSCRLEYLGYWLGKPKYSIAECHKRGMTHAAPLKVKLRLVRKGIAKEQEVYIGELPLMTETGTFIINGAERVVVSQLHRSPGVSLEESTHPSGKRLYSIRIIPYRGAWIEFEGDINEVLYAYIDGRRKILATTLLRALGFSTSHEILKALYPTEKIKEFSRASFKKLEGSVLSKDLIDTKTKDVVGQAGIKLTKELLNALAVRNVTEIEVVRPF